jgi:hypothetical protein
MDELRLIEYLRLKSVSVPVRSRFCPDDRSIAEYFEGLLNDPVRAGFKRHVADCRHCQARIGNLARLHSAENGSRVSGDILAEAKGLERPRSSWRIRSAWSWSAAAAVVLAISTLMVLGPKIDRDAAPVIRAGPETPRITRSTAKPVVKPGITTPVDGEIIEAGSLSVRWTPVHGSLYYNVRVVDEEGFIIRKDRVEGITEWTPPVSHLIEPGRSYYVRVDAYLAGTNYVSSDHVLITVKEQRR